MYLLQRAGVDCSATVLDMDFLEDMMEAMEALRQLKARASASDDTRAQAMQALQTLGDRNEQELEEIMQELRAAFNGDDFQTAQVLTAKLKFLINIREHVKEGLMGSDYVSTTRN